MRVTCQYDIVGDIVVVQVFECAIAVGLISVPGIIVKRICEQKVSVTVPGEKDGREDNAEEDLLSSP